MSFVLVNADFSDCRPEDKAEIYNQLTAWNWIKMQEDIADMTAVWMAALTPGIADHDAVDYAKSKFYSCCKPSCQPKAAFEWGYNEAGFVHLFI